MVALEPRRRANSVYNYVLGYVDKVADGDTRQRHYDRVSGFSQERPILAVSHQLPILAREVEPSQG